MRHVEPAGLQPRPGNFLDPSQGFDFDGAELREVDLGNLRQPPRRSAAGSAGAERLLHPALDVIRRDAALEPGALDATQIHAEFARKAANRRTGVRARKTGFVDGGSCRSTALVRSLRGALPQADCGTQVLSLRRWLAARSVSQRALAASSGSAVLAEASVAAGASSARRAAAAYSSASTSRITLPLETLSPFFTATRFHYAGAGRRHIHRRLLGFQRQQRRIDIDLVARLDQHVDDFDIVEIAEIGNGNVVMRHGLLGC